ncbi:MAG: SPFH domain-containing protein [Muribaculaceae bacterium]|nr:SPFH domain-containing protein [Muribaculaceae bacterium]
MGLFGKGKGGGLMNVIRCDLPEYLVWKWRPLGQETNSTSRENSIRYGSSLRVKDGESAVFVYKQKDGAMQDIITGPFDETIKTANFPVLSSIVGMAFGGESPFQAEVYFINTAGIVKLNFGIPFFDVYDPRFLDFGVPVAIRGSIGFCIRDVALFTKMHRLINFTLEEFKEEIKDAVMRRIKSVVSNAPQDHQLPVMQIERRIDEINDLVKGRLAADLEEDFGVHLRRIDISAIEVDKDSDGYQQLHRVTAAQQAATIEAQTTVNIRNMQDMQRINAENMEATMAIQREEAQRAQRLQTESTYIGAHALNRQADVLQTAANNLGNTGIGGGAGSSGIDPAAFMTSMAVGGAMGSQMGQMVNNMGQAMNGQYQNAMQPGMPGGMQQPGMPGGVNGMTPPPMPGMPPAPAAPAVPEWMLSAGGQQYGPFTIDQLRQMVTNGQMNAQSFVWKQGMPSWVAAAQVPELAAIFAPAAPAAPAMPPMPGGVTPPPMP